MNLDTCWIKGPTPEQIRSRLQSTLSEKTPFERLILGCKNGLVWLVQDCLDEGVDPSAQDNRAIRWASYNGHIEVVKLLLTDKRVDPSAQDNFAIRWASGNGHTGVVRLLLTDKRVYPSAGDNLAIKWASENGHTEVVKLLLTDKRVREKLSPELKEKYKKFLK